MDTSDPDISFDDLGQCNHCRQYFTRIEKEVLHGDSARHQLDRAINSIAAEGKGKDYDCVAGVSGGVDSTWVLYQLKRLGLRPLAVHFDNGWNSELAVGNIKNALNHLKIDLHTEVVDWEEFRDLQLSFLRASVPNCEIPTDHGITATLVKTASAIGTRYVINGSNVVTEGILPIAWVYYSHDLYHLRAIHKRFGTRPLRTFPQLSLASFVVRILSGRYRMMNILNMLDYDKNEAMTTLARELHWQPYGGKHYESIFTRWYQGFYLPVKFGYDKRRAHLSALVCAGQMDRETALGELSNNPYATADVDADTDFVVRKLGISHEALEQMITSENRRHTDYPNRRLAIEGLSGFRQYVRTLAKRV